MLYTFGDVVLKETELVRTALTKISGIGLKRSSYLCDLIGLEPGARIVQLSHYFFFLLIFLIKQYYGTDLFLRRARENRLADFLSFKSYRALKYNAGLPIRGQRTHTNAQTSKNFRYSGKRLKLNR